MNAAVAQRSERGPCKAEVAGSNPSRQHLVLTAHQPVYLPWCGFFHKLSLADRFVVFDAVQFERHGYSNRVRIKAQGGPMWLTVPVKHGLPTLNRAEIVPGPWARKHLNSIAFAYRAAPHFKRYYEPLADILSGQWKYLAGLNAAVLAWLMDELGLRLSVVSASEQDFQGEKSALVLDMCRKLGAQTYVFGAQGRDYADTASFTAAGVRPVFQDYRHPVYPQLHGQFVPGLSVLDLLMNVGPRAMDIIQAGNISRETLKEGT